MSQEPSAALRRRYWITLALFVTLIHYCAYLWPLIFDSSEITLMKDEYPEFKDVMRTQLVLLIIMSIIALIFSVTQFKHWKITTIICSGIGIYNGEIVDVYRAWFLDIDSLESLYSRWAVYIKFPGFIASGFRNGIFVPLLYSAVIFLTYQDWRLSRDR